MLNMNDLAKLAEVYEGIPIWDTFPGSPSHVAGVRQGDILVEANGHAIRTLDDYFEHVSNSDSSVRLKVIRDHEPMEFVMHWGNAPSITPEQAQEMVSGVLPSLVAGTKKREDN